MNVTPKVCQLLIKTLLKKTLNWEVVYRGKISILKKYQEIDFYYFYVLVNQIANGQMLEKANIVLLTKEATDKDCSLKTEIIAINRTKEADKISGEAIWK